MTSAQVALNGLQRCLTYTQVQRDSDSSFYSSGIESLKQIRDLAAQIMIASNEALAKVGLDESLEIIPNQTQKSELSVDILKEAARVSEETASQVVNQMFAIVFNQFKGESQQNVVITTGESSKIQNDFIEEVLETPIIDESTVEIVQNTKSHQYIHDFKQILRNVGDLPASNFSSPRVKSVASLISEYFDVRFCKKYDSSRLHWFSKEKMRDYLLSILIRCCDFEDLGIFQQFYSDFREWLANLRVTPSKYTLPPECNLIFFGMLNKSPEEITRPLSSDALNRLYDLWSELWELGYCKFDNLTYVNYRPSKDLDWIQSNLISASKLSSKDVGCRNIEANIQSVLSEWLQLQEYESFDLCKAISIRSNKLLQQFDYEDMVKLPTRILRESLRCYIKVYGNSSINELKTKIASMKSIMQFADDNFSDIQSRYEYLNEYPPDQLDLIEVFETYVMSDYCVKD